MDGDRMACQLADADPQPDRQECGRALLKLVVADDRPGERLGVDLAEPDARRPVETLYGAVAICVLF